jgi:hypothetical protein
MMKMSIALLWLLEDALLFTTAGDSEQWRTVEESPGI